MALEVGTRLGHDDVTTRLSGESDRHFLIGASDDRASR